MSGLADYVNGVYVGVCIIGFVLWRALRARWRLKLTDDNAILVTGCDSGFGYHIVKTLLASTSAQIVAGYITEEGKKSLAAMGSRVTAVKLDVTSDADVEAVFESISKSGKVLWGVVNNAGIGAYGWVEGLTMDCYEKILMINYLGTLRVTKRALPTLRINKGRLVCMGSLGCRVPSAFGSAYLPTKAALASFQDCLRQEVWRFGMRCSLVEPGFFATGMLHRSADIGDIATSSSQSSSGDLTSVYGSWKEKMKRTEASVIAAEKANGGEKGVERVTAAVLDALTTMSPKSRYLIGLDANLLGRVGPFIPDWVMDLAQTYLV